MPEGDCLLGGLVEVWVAAAFGDLDPAGDAEFGDVDEEADDALGMAAGGGGGVCGGAVVDAGVRAGRDDVVAGDLQRLLIALTTDVDGGGRLGRGGAGRGRRRGGGRGRWSGRRGVWRGLERAKARRAVKAQAEAAAGEQTA